MAPARSVTIRTCVILKNPLKERSDNIAVKRLNRKGYI